MAALAAEPGVGRAQGALIAGFPSEARATALSAIAADPSDGEAWAVYLDASAAAGLGALAVRELGVSTVPLREVPSEPHELRLLLTQGREKEAWAWAKELRAHIDERPDFLLPLFEVGLPSRRLTREQDRVLRLVADAVPEHAQDAAWLHRAQRLLMADATLAAPVVAHLVSLDEPAAPPRMPWSRLERERQAHLLAQTGVLPGMYRDEARDVVSRAAVRLQQDGRGSEALELWSELRTRDRSPESAAHHARLALQTASPILALELADDAVAAAAFPTSDDLAASLRELRSARLAEALAVRARALQGTYEYEAAGVDLGLAALLHGAIDPELADALQPFIQPLAAATRARHATRSGSPTELAIQRGADAVAAGDSAEALSMVDDALLLIGAQGGAAASAELAAHALEVRAAALLALDDAEGALVAASMADAISPWDTASLAVLRGQAHEALGQREAAWMSWALASALGVDIGDALERTYTGPAEDSSALVDSKVRLAPESAPAPTEAPEPQTADPTPPRPVAPKSLPRVSERVPTWKLDTRWGHVSDRSMRGRGYALVVWSGDCEACLQTVSTLGRVGRQLRRDGHDFAVVTMSVDSPEDYARLEGWAESTGSAGRDPDLAAELGAWELPTTWFVDPSGVVRAETQFARPALLESMARDLFDLGADPVRNHEDGR